MTHVLGIGFVAIYSALSLATYPTQYPSLSLYLLVWFFGWALFSVAITSRQIRMMPLIGWAIVVRCIAIFSYPPYEDDFFRYLWDGYAYLKLGSPYLFPPSAFFGYELPEVMMGVLDGVNFPDVPTIYAPGAQAIFLLPHLFGSGSLLTWKLYVFLADISVICLLLKSFGERSALLYALCPLIILEFSFGVHFDVFGILFLLLSLRAYSQKELLLAGAWLGIASCIKVFALIAGAGLLLRHPFRVGIPLCLIILCFYGPFIFQGQNPALFVTSTFILNWEYNSFVLPLARLLFEDETARRAILILFFLYFGILVVFLFRKRIGMLSFSASVLFAALLCSPVLHPWYLSWLLLIAAVSYGTPNNSWMNPTPLTWLLAPACAVSLSYIHGMSLGDPTLYPYDHPWYVRPLEALVTLVICITLYSLKNTSVSSKSV